MEDGRIANVEVQKIGYYFPNIRSREAVLDIVNHNDSLQAVFSSWLQEEQDRFLDYCTGVRGVKILYDPYFKEIFNPEYTPERLETLLSLILGERVRVKQILPNDSTRLTDEGSLLVTDVVVEFEDGRIANVEVQKIGYYFPGERTACYISDLMLRQYKRVRNQKKEKFSYKDIREVYTIIFYESSPAKFESFPDTYIHHGHYEFDSGLDFHLPMQTYMIPLDIFKKSIYNKGITNQLEAWLAFLCFDEPEQIIKLITEYPEFKPLYQHVYEICENVERMIMMFSKELLMMDRNTVRLMVDDLTAKVAAQNAVIAEQNAALADKDAALADKDAALADMDAALADKDSIIESLRRQLNETSGK